MGTRSLTHIKEEDGTTLLTLYGQYDGYPDGMGRDLVDFLAPFRIVNGFGSDAEMGKTANGMGCLAAQLVKHFKQEVGNIYVSSPGASDCWEEYVYEVYPLTNGDVGVRCARPEADGGHVFFEGAAAYLDLDFNVKEQVNDE